MIAVDWSHTKGLATYDGKKVKIEDRRAFLKRIKAGESKRGIQSIHHFQSAIVLEQGCPLSLIHDIIKAGCKVYTISNRATQDYRVEHGIEKSDETDAKLIWELLQNGAKSTEVTLTDSDLQIYSLYNKYKRYQKARVAVTLMKKAHERHFGEDGESKRVIDSTSFIQPSSPYDISIKALQEAEKDCMKQLKKIVGGESTVVIDSNLSFQPPAIRGLGDKIWIGLIVTANPANFKCLSAYLRYCGLTNDVMESHKYNRHAKMLYHVLAECVLKSKDPVFRPIYDKCKADIAEKYPDYTKLHVHNAALNRTATFLAKRIYQYLVDRNFEAKST